MLSLFYYKPLVFRMIATATKVLWTKEMQIDMINMYGNKRDLILLMKEYNHAEPFKEDII